MEGKKFDQFPKCEEFKSFGCLTKTPHKNFKFQWKIIVFDIFDFILVVKLLKSLKLSKNILFLGKTCHMFSALNIFISFLLSIFSQFSHQNKNTLTIFLIFSGVRRSFIKVINEKFMSLNFHTSQNFTR